MTPIVSVIVPVYNRADMVGTAIQSILDQVGVPFEIVVVDDASTDDLAGSLARFAGAPIRLVRLAINGGAAMARNIGIESARGEWIAFLDSDDVWLPGKLEKQLDFLRRKGLVAGCTDYFIRRSADSEDLEERHLAFGDELGLGDLVWGCYVSPGATLVLRRDIWSEIGPLDTDYRRFEDWEWLIRFTRRYRLGLLAQPLSCVRFSAPPPRDQVMDGLERLEKGLGSMLKREAPELGKRFGAGIAMERAAMAYRCRRPFSAGWHVACSLALVPFCNKAYANVIAPRVRRMVQDICKPRPILTGQSR